MANTINGDDGVISGSAGLKSAADATGILALQTNGTTRFQIGAAGQLGIGGATYGTSGQVLTSGGASAAPTWTTVSGSSQWTTSSSDIYYTTGNVSVGTTTPTAKLNVDRASNVAGGLTAVASNPQFAITNSYQYGYPTGMLFKSVLQSGGSIVNNASIWSEWSSDNNSYLGFATTAGGTLTERARIPAAGGFQCVNSLSVGNATPTTSGAGITFPATQDASTNANTLDDYEEGTFVGTLTGCTTSPAIDFYYVKVGRCVTLGVTTGQTATSNSTACTVTGLPATIRPLVTNICWARVRNNGADYFGMVAIDSAGVITVYWDVNANNFVASGQKGLLGCVFSYHLTN